MIIKSKHTAPTIPETMALRLLRACPKAMEGMSLPQSHVDTLCRFRKLLSSGARQPFFISRHNNPAPSPRERWLLNSLAAAQTNDHGLLVKLLEWMVDRRHRSDICAAFHDVADVLRAQNVYLTTHFHRPPSRRVVAGLYAVVGRHA